VNTEKDTILKLRRQLLANGYSPIPNRDKACYLPSWPKVTIDEDALKKWSRMHGNTATGLRIENGLCAVDLDINHPVIEDVAEAMLSVIPEDLAIDRLERHGKGHKFAWYCQTDDLFARLHTRSWVAPGDTEDDGTHMIEIFGGGSARQFGSFGPHTVENNKVKVAYKWADESPADVPLNALDILTKDQAFAMLDAAEAELQRQGFTPVARTKRGEGTPGRVYDLTEGMLFDLLDGRTVSLADLQAMVSDGYSGNCSASWLDGPIAKNRNRCLVSASATGHLTVWESAAGVTHMPAAIKPTDHTAQVDRIAEKLREKQDARKSRLTAEDDHISGAAKLLNSYAFMPLSSTPVVPLWAHADDEAYTLANFRTRMMPFCGVEVGKRGGEKKINPVDVWLSNSNRIEVAGMRMRPDRERPTFEEEGQTWLNTYRPPDLGAADGGDASGGIELIEQLVPDAREREWFRQWLAFKWLNPHVPGPSVVMVARDFGTGRGTFGTLIAKLFGQRYVVNVPFDIFAGMNYQSQYTDWGLGALFAIVNESSATGDMSSYKAKHNVYEHIKEVIEPRAAERLFVSKKTSTRAISTATNMIMTNNMDALPLPEDDRRLAVLTNGNKRAPEFWDMINSWMMVQSNLAAFARWLEETDLSDYDPYAPPIMTTAKMEMTEMNQSQLTKMMHEALSEIEGYFVVEQVLLKMAEIEAETRAKLPEHWRDIASKEVLRHCYMVRYDNTRKVQLRRRRRKFDVLHKTKHGAQNYRGDENLLLLLTRNGQVFGPDEEGDGISQNQKTALRLVKRSEDGKSA
jgi:hypothetical protein